MKLALYVARKVVLGEFGESGESDDSPKMEAKKLVGM